jgi:hypothetical protein
MSYHPRIESKDHTSFTTSRCRNSELWFVNNKQLEARILAYLAKYTTIYEVILYGFAIEGNHIQMAADFPKENRADFKRVFNSVVARLVPTYCKDYSGGRLFERRYSCEIMPQHTDDIEDRVFYLALQAVQDGLVQKISDYPGYNFFHDAIHNIEREHKVVDWTAYNRAKRGNPNISIKYFETTYKLKYHRIPGYEDLSQKDYSKALSKKLEKRRTETVKKRLEEGKGFLGTELLKQVKPGARPQSTKKSDRNSFRPRVLSICPLRRAEAKKFYFDCYTNFKDASKKLREGILNIIFPHGMYKPPFRPPPIAITA